MKFSLRLAAPSVLACLALACGESDTVSVVPLPPGAACPNGGIQITVDNGAPHVVCNGSNGTPGSNGVDGGTGTNGNNGNNGSNGYSTLFVTKTLPSGDASCPTGGQEIQSGLDNGANGGTANNGVLEAGEVLNTSYVCNGGGYHVGSIAPPAGAAGTGFIKAIGGDGVDGGGGNGGQIQIGFQNGTLGGHVKVFATGAADPSFIFPAQPATSPGDHPVVITADTVVGPQPADAGPGVLYFDGEHDLIIVGADGGAFLATSLSVAANATLAIGASQVEVIERQTAPVLDASLFVNGACVNAGTITVNPSITATLQLGCLTYFGASSSHLVNDGAAGNSNLPAGQDGQNLEVDAESIWNHGTVSANGGDGTIGGNGGHVGLYANEDDFGALALYNSGAISARGGRGTQGIGGNGTSISLNSSGDVNNSGALDASGGAGLTGGGAGGSIGFTAGQNNYGSLRNSGAMTASGGAVDAACSADDSDDDDEAICRGGNGGNIELQVIDGAMANNSAINLIGGASPNGTGGPGGSYDAFVYDNGTTIFSIGNLTFSGNVDVSGGAGRYGGGGSGQFYATTNAGTQPNGQEIIFYGYAQLNVSGGNSTGANAGNGGEINLFNIDYQPGRNEGRGVHARSAQTLTTGPGGSVVNYVPLIANGGAGNSAALTDSAGGAGGTIRLTTQSNNFYPDDNFEQVINAGPLSLRGGAGNNGGGGGMLKIYGDTGVTNSGPADARGGAAPAPEQTGEATQYGFAGNGPSCNMNIASDNGEVINTASLNLGGGDGTYRGGSAGELFLAAKTVVDSGSLLSAGGAATGVSSNAEGGNGGVIIVTSNGGGLSQITATPTTGITVAGGTAPATGTKGESGTVLIDTWNVTSAWTH